MATEKRHALYLMKQDGKAYSRAELIPGDEVEAKRAEGYVDPIGQKANGTEWNAEDDLEAQDAAAECAKATAESAAKKADKKAKELEAARKAQEALPKPQDRPDFKVEVVQPAKEEKAPKGK